MPTSEDAAAVDDCVVATADTNDVASEAGIPALVRAAISEEPIEASIEDDCAASMDDDTEAGVMVEGPVDKINIIVVPVPVVVGTCMMGTLRPLSGYVLC